VPVLTLGPGTGPVESLLLGGVLASIDPVAIHDVRRDNRISRSIRRALEVEASVNDIVVLPVVLIEIAALAGQAGSADGGLSIPVRILGLSGGRAGGRDRAVVAYRS
jgi:NhaP-type Na+/H+ or K+/H+ antiporter